MTSPALFRGDVSELVGGGNPSGGAVIKFPSNRRNSSRRIFLPAPLDVGDDLRGDAGLFNYQNWGDGL